MAETIPMKFSPVTKLGLINEATVSESPNIVLCQLCRDDCQKEDTENFCVDSTHDPVCKGCIASYINFKVDSAFLGVCPKISCPIDHSDKKTRILDFSRWTKSGVVSQETVTKYQSLAKSLLAFLCGGCHTLKSISVSANPLSSEQLAAAKKSIEDKLSAGEVELALFNDNLQSYCDGILAVEEFFARMNTTFFPSLLSVDDREAWMIFKNVLMLIEDPERQSTLHLRYLRARPRMWTPCCNREHCFTCKTKDFHQGRTCVENTAMLDKNIVNCPACGIAIAKGDGCNTLTCVCSRQFSWSEEVEMQGKSCKFAQDHPTDTAQACVQVLCLKFEGAQSPDSFLEASAWQSRHRVEVQRELIRLWLEMHGQCPSQASAVLNLQKASVGMKQASEAWIAQHSKEVDSCKEKTRFALASIFHTMYPNPKDRPSAAARLLHDKFSLSPQFKAKHAQLLASVRLWVDANLEAYSSELRAREQRQYVQFLHLHANKRPSDCDHASLLPVVSKWDVGNSNTRLAFSNGDMTVKRPGSVSSFPAAVAALPSERCMLAVVIDVAISSGNNWLTFGLARTGFELQGSDGIGPTRDTWGINDDRGSQRETCITASRQEVAKCRKLRQGDVLKAVVDTTLRTLELSINDSEVVHSIDIPTGTAQDYIFAMTFANDHQVTILSEETEACVGSSPASRSQGQGQNGPVSCLNPEQLQKLLALKRCLRKLYKRQESLMNAYADASTGTGVAGGVAGGAQAGGVRCGSSEEAMPAQMLEEMAQVWSNLHGNHAAEAFDECAGYIEKELGLDRPPAPEPQPFDVLLAEPGTWKKCFQVTYSVPPGLPIRAQIQPSSEVVDHLPCGATFQADNHAVTLFQGKALRRFRLADGRGWVCPDNSSDFSPTVKEITPTISAESVKGSGRSGGGSGSASRVSTSAAKTHSGPEMETLAAKLRDFVAAKPQLDAANAWKAFLDSYTRDAAMPPLPAEGIKPRKLCLAHPHVLQWVEKPIMPGILLSWIRPAAEESAAKEDEAEELAQQNKKELTWGQITGAICWKLCDAVVKANEWAKQAAAEATEMGGAIAVAFLVEHGESAAFVAAGRIALAAETPPEELREARAYAAAFPDEMQAWYEYNASLEESMFTIAPETEGVEEDEEEDENS